MSDTRDIEILIRARKVIEAATILVEGCDDSRLGEQDRYVLSVLRDRLYDLRSVKEAEIEPQSLRA